MSTYDFPQLVKHWGMEAVTNEQAIGQILLHLQSLRERVNTLEKSVPMPDQGEVVVDTSSEESKDEGLATDAGIGGSSDVSKLS